jgi:murein L,D-transpeptidase YafK
MRMHEDIGISYPAKRVLIRAFKQERELEVWVAESWAKPAKLLKTYAIAAASGSLGPKSREGDYQVPEGLYEIDRFNPLSNFLLSFRLNYPNASDRKRSAANTSLGGDIYIHGNTVSIGCLAMTDDVIQELYLVVWDAHRAGQKKIPVEIFPFRMTDSNLARESATHPQWAEFWRHLQASYTKPSFRTPRKA